MIAQRICAHPRLMTLPEHLDRFYGIICVSCAKRLVIGIEHGYCISGGDKKEFCLAALIKETFGDAWGHKAEQECWCSACKGGKV